MIDSRLPELSKNDFARYNGDVIKKERGAVFMLQLLETGKALYVLAGICVLGIMTRAITKRFYKRLIKESTNLALTKNKSLKELRQKAENTYRMNQGMSDSGAWLEHQLYEMKIMGVNLSGWSSLCMQWTWLCLLAGGLGAFLSYWYRLDTFYIVLYGGGSVLMAMITMLFDNGTAGGWREQLQASLQDYLENVLYPRMARSMAGEGSRSDKGMQERSGLRGVRTIGKREGKLVRRTQPWCRGRRRRYRAGNVRQQCVLQKCPGTVRNRRTDGDGGSQRGEAGRSREGRNCGFRRSDRAKTYLIWRTAGKWKKQKQPESFRWTSGRDEGFGQGMHSPGTAGTKGGREQDWNPVGTGRSRIGGQRRQKTGFLRYLRQWQRRGIGRKSGAEDDSGFGLFEEEPGADCCLS